MIDLIEGVSRHDWCVMLDDGAMGGCLIDEVGCLAMPPAWSCARRRSAAAATSTWSRARAKVAASSSGSSRTGPQGAGRGRRRSEPPGPLGRPPRPRRMSRSHALRRALPRGPGGAASVRTAARPVQRAVAGVHGHHTRIRCLSSRGAEDGSDLQSK